MPTATSPPATPARCSSPAATARRSSRPTTTFTPEEQGTFILHRHARDGGHAVDHRHRHGDVEHHGHRVGHHRSGRRAPSRWQSPASRPIRHGGRRGQRHGHRVRRLRQRGDRLHRHGRTSPAATPRPSLPASYTFTGADAGTHTFSVTLETAGTQSITATDTVAPSITGSETGIIGAAGRGQYAGGHRLPDDRHGRGGQQRHGHRVRRLRQRGHRLHRHGRAFQQRRPRRLCRPATPSPAPTRDRTPFRSRSRPPGTQSITASRHDRHRASAAPRRASSVQAARRQAWSSPGFPTNPTAGTAYNFTVTAPRRLRQRRHRLHGHGQLLPAATPNAVLPGQLHLHRCRRRHAYLLGHARDRRASVDHGNRHDERASAAPRRASRCRPRARQAWRSPASRPVPRRARPTTSRSRRTTPTAM